MKKIVALTILVITVGAIAFFILQPKQIDSLLTNDGRRLRTLEGHWALGNVVSLIRHTERCDLSEDQCVDGDNGITISGAKEARKIGVAYKNLPAHTTVIYNSPIKRAAQTADFMFGRKTTSQPWLGENCRESLQENIFKYKEDGKNLILITHSGCINSLKNKQGATLIESKLNKDETYGYSIFLTVDKHKREINILGCLLARDWTAAYK
ncbi:MAG: histidine phosphatase family protein [Porticoccus sp.]